MDTTARYRKYVHFTENDFIIDPYFQDWVIYPDTENTLFWTGFQESHPDKAADVLFARKFLGYVHHSLRDRSDIPDNGLVRYALATHLQKIERLKETSAVKVRRMHVLKRTLQVAAIFGTVILIFSALFYHRADNSNEKVFVKTPYGKFRSVTLPDSSKVVLNAKSVLEYAHDWKQGQKREVWLDGEAFFEVKHLNKSPGHVTPAEQFLVHTRDLTITVLGTSFNIRQRRGKTEIVLQTGKISLLFNRNAYPALVMKPGDMVTYDPGGHNLSRNSTVAENYTAWKENKLILNDPTVNRLIEYLEDNFGKKILLQHPAMGKKKIEGPVLFNNLDDALFIISTVMHADVIKTNDSTVVIRQR